MSMFDTIKSVAGSGALQQIAARTGLSAGQLESVIGALAPMVLPKIEHEVAQGNLAVPASDAALPEAGTDAAEDHGNSVLGSIFGSKDVSRSVAQQTSGSTGVGVDAIKKVLPQIASIALGALVAGKIGGIGRR